MKQLTETYKVYRELPLFKVSTILTRGIDSCHRVLEPAGQSGEGERGGEAPDSPHPLSLPGEQHRWGAGSPGLQ